jgi:hypothetical protein
MELKKHWLAMASSMVIVALLAACAGPAAAPRATPVPPSPTPELPTPTPIPPTAVPSPLDVALAYESAWNTFDANAVGALFAEPFYATYDGLTMRDPAAWSRGWPYGMARGEHMRIKLRDCQVSGDSVTCTVGSTTDCFQMDVIETLTVKDGKITQLRHRTTPEEGAKWEAYSDDLTKWAERQDLEEARAWLSEDAKGVYGYDWGVALEALCKKYEAAKGQAQDSVEVVKAWLDAINNGNLEAALALMTEHALFQGVFTDPPPNVLGWFIGGTFNYGAPDCKPSSDRLECTFVFHDGCSAAYGADDLTAKMTFAFQDDKIRRVVVMEGDGDWAGYDAWLGKMFAWAGTNRAEELAQVEGYSQAAGAMAVKLCQEYAKTLK